MSKRAKKLHMSAEKSVGNLPAVLQKIIIDYIDMPQQLHMWSHSLKYGQDWQWVVLYIPEIGTVDFYKYIADETEELVNQIGELPIAITGLCNGGIANLYSKFYELDGASEFYIQVAYAMLRTSPESFRSNHYDLIKKSHLITPLFSTLTRANLHLWDKKVYHKPHINLKMLDCLLFACKQYGIKFANLGNDVKIIKIILGIGTINNVSEDWYLNCFDILDVPVELDPLEFYEYVAYFADNTIPIAAISQRWPALS